MQSTLPIIAVLLAALVSACTTPQPALKHNNVNSVLWLQSAAEAQANSLQTYQAAALSLDQAINDKTWTALPEPTTGYQALLPAIILGVDETVLNNTQYQVQRVIEGNQFTLASWDQWMALAAAPDIPGAVAFINQAASKGVSIFFVTNRECNPQAGRESPCPQALDTLKNLKAAGIKQVSVENLMLKQQQPDWTSEKQSRRDAVAKGYRVIMLFGDDLGDFLPNVKRITTEQRTALVKQNKSYWGTKWFALANPTYGSWLRVLNQPITADELHGY